MTISVFNPDGVEILGNSRVVALPAVADLDAATVAEANAGTAIECSIKQFGATTDVSYVDAQYLCDKVAQRRVGRREFNMEPLVIKVDPQDTTAIEAIFYEDAKVTLLHRPGINHTDAFASGQQYQAVQGTVAAVDLVAVDLTEGAVYELRVALAVEKATRPFGTIAA